MSAPRPLAVECQIDCGLRDWHWPDGRPDKPTNAKPTFHQLLFIARDWAATAVLFSNTQQPQLVAADPNPTSLKAHLRTIPLHVDRPNRHWLTPRSARPSE